MTLQELLNKYGINQAELKQVLDGAGIGCDLSELSEITDGWEELLKGYQHLKNSEEAKVSSKKRYEKSLLKAKIGIVKRKFDGHGFMGVLDNFEAETVSRKNDCIFYFKEGEDDYLERQVVFINVTTSGRRRATILETEFLGTVNPANTGQIILLHPFFKGHYLPIPLGFPEGKLYCIFRFQVLRPTDYGRTKLVKFSEVLPSDSAIVNSLKDYFAAVVKNREWNMEESGGKISIGRYLDGEKKAVFFEKMRFREYRQLEEENLSEQLPFFLKEWEYILGEPVPLEEVTAHIVIAKKQHLKLWLEDYLPMPDFGEKTLQIIASLLVFEKNSSLNEAAKILNKLRGVGKLKEGELSEALGAAIEDIQTEVALIYYQDVFQMLGEQEVTQILNRKVEGALYIERCLNGDTARYDFAKISRAFPALKSNLQQELLEELAFRDVEKILKGPAIKLPKNLALTIYQQFKKHIAKSLKFCAFDIEIRRSKLLEIGYINELGAKVLRKREEENREDLSYELFDEFRKAEVIIGHNVLDFDLPQLEVRYNTKVEGTKVWDTLKVELLLSPQASTHALKTSHTALEDAQQSLCLFYNQLSRIAFLEEAGLARVFPFIPNVFYKFILRIRQMGGWLTLEFLTILEDELLDLLHTKKRSPLVDKVSAQLAKFPTKNVLLVCPELIGCQLYGIPGLQLLGGKLTEMSALVVEEKVKEKYQSTELAGAALLQFLDNCKTMGKLPKYALLSSYLQGAVRREASVADICQIPEIPLLIEQGTWCISATYLLEQADRFATSTDWHILEVGKEISEITDKKLLAEWTFAEFNELPDVEDIWVNFSGGKSFALLHKNQLISSGLDIEYLDNFWVEKRDYDTYLIWGKQMSSSVVECLPTAVYQQMNIAELGVNLKEIHPIVPIVSTRYLNFMNLTRLNPTTGYRDRYWVFQIQLMYKLQSINEHPTVLFVQNKAEVEPLIKVVEAGEFYVPSRKASMLRQMELLHQSNEDRKVSIQAMEDLEAVLSVNYIGALQIILDSFDIHEKWYALQQSDLLIKITEEAKDIDESGFVSDIDLTDNELVEEEEEEEDEESDGHAPKLPLRNDVTGLLALQKPLIDYYKFIVHQNHPRNDLAFLDARLEDRFQIKKMWNCVSTPIRLWQELEIYKSALKLTNLSFSARIIKEDLELDIEESMEKIRKVFIKGDYPFYDYQVPYLKVILPAKKDLLITLPTGGGKSILFQGPALYRSSLTRGLTLVITPLKALMEDQVMALWNLGFWTSVDFLNQDKGIEVQQIYRRIAGGELNLLFITPERFRSRSFETAIQQRMELDNGLDYCVFDEAHCISQWGSEFRPDYQQSARKIWKMKKAAGNSFPILLFSATVSEQIYHDFNRLFL